MTRDKMQEMIMKSSYSVQNVQYGMLGASFEMRRKFKGGTPFFAHHLPTTSEVGAIDFYFPTRQFSAEEIIKQFNDL